MSRILIVDDNKNTLSALKMLLQLEFETVIAIANGQFFGGGMQIAPGAILDDDLFDIVIVKGMNKSRFITCLPSIYKGSHGQYPEVTFMQGRSVKASSPGRVLLEVDGEQPGILNAEITLLPKAMHVIC